MEKKEDLEMGLEGEGRGHEKRKQRTKLSDIGSVNPKSCTLKTKTCFMMLKKRD